MRLAILKTTAAVLTPTQSLLALLFAAALFRLAVTMGLPIWFLHTRIYEDGLYMQQAASLASWHWLGSFDQFTLLHGPGYPFYLVASGFSGLQLSAAHALFQIGAIAVAAWAIYKLTASRALAAVAFLALALYPAAFVPEMQQVIPAQIYWAQVLLVFSLITISLYVPPQDNRATIAVSAFAGAMLGWTWLTGEENTWLIPGLVLLVAGAFVANRSTRRALVDVARHTAIATGTCIAVIAIVMTANLIAYGTFSARDSANHHLDEAIAALQRIDVGPQIPNVPVPKAARARAAEVSPAFAPFAESLDDMAIVKKWRDLGCEMYAKSCGDLAEGWLALAMRDVAAARGLYEAPGQAAARFEAIAQEITAACAQGNLKCRGQAGSEKQTSNAQGTTLYAKMETLAGQAAFFKVPDLESVADTKVNTDPDKLQRYLRLLNSPYISAPGPTGQKLTASGWFRDSASAIWPSFEVYAQDGRSLPFTFERYASPDIQEGFNDPYATENRFDITFVCPDKCSVAARAGGKPPLTVPFTSDHDITASENTATIHIDVVAYDWLATRQLTPLQWLATHARTALVSIYGLLVPLLLLAGLIGVIAALDGSVGTRTLNPTLLVALAAWLLAGAHIVMLLQTDLPLEQSVTLRHTAPAAYMALYAAFLSFGAIALQARRL